MILQHSADICGICSREIDSYSNEMIAERYGLYMTREKDRFPYKFRAICCIE